MPSYFSWNLFYSSSLLGNDQVTWELIAYKSGSDVDDIQAYIHLYTIYSNALVISGSCDALEAVSEFLSRDVMTSSGFR